MRKFPMFLGTVKLEWMVARLGEDSAKSRKVDYASVNLESAVANASELANIASCGRRGVAPSGGLFEPPESGIPGGSGREKSWKIFVTTS